jgi:hypothetical protein
MPTGAYRIVDSLYDRGTLQRLPLSTGTDSASLGPLWIQPDETRTPRATEAEARFGGVIALERSSSVREDGALRLRLLWRAERPPTDYTVFVHVLGDGGRLLAQADGQPTRPTGTWESGDVVVDGRRRRLPARAGLSGHAAGAHTRGEPPGAGRRRGPARAPPTHCQPSGQGSAPAAPFPSPRQPCWRQSSTTAPPSARSAARIGSCWPFCQL